MTDSSEEDGLGKPLARDIKKRRLIPAKYGFDTPEVNKLIESKIPEFAQHRAAGHTGLQAMKMMYPDKPLEEQKLLLNKFVRSPAARDAVRQCRRKLFDRSSILKTVDMDFIKKEYLSVYDEARDAGDRNNALRVLESLGKHLGMFIERSESKLLIDGNLTVTHDAIDQDLQQLAKASGLELEFIDGIFEEITSRPVGLPSEDEALPAPLGEEPAES